jgi:hypothetical protein
MATPRQNAANGLNARRGGPKTPAGKLKTKLNGLKHGLRSQEVVLPTEDPDAFRAHLDAWMDDWKPPTMARAQLVEDAAVAAWRKRRCVRVEADRLTSRVRGGRAAYDRLVDGQVAAHVLRLADQPAESLRALRATRPGVARLVKLWEAIAEAAAEPSRWNDVSAHHLRLFHLQGFHSEDPRVKPLRDASARLYLRNDPELAARDDMDEEPLGDAAAAEACAAIVGLARECADTYRVAWSDLPDPSSVRDRYAESLAFEPQPGDAPLLRYEGQLTRQFHKALADLIKLTESGADLVEDEPEAIAPSEPNSTPEVHVDEDVVEEFSGADPAPGTVEIVAGGPQSGPETSVSDVRGRSVPVGEGRPGLPAAPIGR